MVRDEPPPAGTRRVGGRTGRSAERRIAELTRRALAALAAAPIDAAAKEGWDYSQVADLISSHAAPGDCLMVDNTVPWRPGPI
ncbi:hypothetical protein H7K35_00950, partial [Mycobacterium seoulense]|nr:hypothetical protein [Mycobacterium seoulense]